jgi:hypothetical protein
MTSSADAVNRYFTAANTFQNKITSNDPSLAADLKNLQMLYQKALVSANTSTELPKLQKRNTEILLLSKTIIAKHLEQLSKNIENLQKELETSEQAISSFMDTAVKTVIKVDFKAPLTRLTLHGQGGNLDWNTGIALSRLSDGTLGYESKGKLEFKFKLDGQWENCGNRTLEAGKTEIIKPAVNMPVVPVTVKCNPKQITEKDTLYLRGIGSVKICGETKSLSWDKGIQLTREGNNFFLILDEPAEIKFKVLINDDPKRWSTDADRTLKKGENIEFETTFEGQPTIENNSTGSRVAYNDKGNAKSITQIQSRVMEGEEDFNFGC